MKVKNIIGLAIPSALFSICMYKIHSFNESLEQKNESLEQNIKAISDKLQKGYLLNYINNPSNWEQGGMLSNATTGVNNKAYTMKRIRLKAPIILSSSVELSTIDNFKFDIEIYSNNGIFERTTNWLKKGILPANKYLYLLLAIDNNNELTTDIVNNFIFR